MATQTTDLPRDAATDVRALRDYPQATGTFAPATRLAGYVAAGETPEDRANRFDGVRKALGADEHGVDAFTTVMRAGQAPFMAQQGDVAGRLRDAFERNADDGRFGAADVRALVGRQSAVGWAEQAQEPIGTPHPGLTTAFARVSTYFEHLPASGAAAELRATFAEASLERASALAGSQPATAAALDAQAANALADLPASVVRAQLAGVERRDGREGVSRFALGAAAGLAERAKPVDFATPNGHVEYRADGLARTMLKLGDRAAEPNAAGRPAEASDVTARLFVGTARFLTEARGTELDRALGEHDERTGLRHAMNDTLAHGFPAIVRLTTSASGQGFSEAAHGSDTFASYSRFEFSATDDAHGRATASEAQAVVGDRLGTLAGNILKAVRDRGAALGRDFGEATFGAEPHRSLNATMTLAETMGAIRNGLVQDYDVRLDRNAHDREAVRAVFETSGSVAKITATVAGRIGGEGIVGGVELVESLADAAKDGAPLASTDPNTRVPHLDSLAGRFKDEFAQYRGDADLAARFDLGRAAAGVEYSRYATERTQRANSRSAEESQVTAFGRVMTAANIIAPEARLAQPTTERLSDAEMRLRLEHAVAEYNAVPNRLPLMPPRDVNAWDGNSRHGTVLRLGEDTYAISIGRGGYQTFDVERTNGVHPIPGVLTDLNRDGSIEQAGRERERTLGR